MYWTWLGTAGASQVGGVQMMKNATSRLTSSYSKKKSSHTNPKEIQCVTAYGAFCIDVCVCVEFFSVCSGK